MTLVFVLKILKKNKTFYSLEKWRDRRIQTGISYWEDALFSK